MSRPHVTLIVARAQNGVIGQDGSLPWHLPADLKRFKALTLGKPMVMGRKTFESFPAPLPGRRHIVLTRDASWAAAAAEVAHSAQEALAAASESEVSLIGGAEIFRAFLEQGLVDRAEVTVIWRNYVGDTRFDLEQADWIEEARAFHPAFGDMPAFTYFTLRRDPASHRAPSPRG